MMTGSSQTDAFATLTSAFVDVLVQCISLTNENAALMEALKRCNEQGHQKLDERTMRMLMDDLKGLELERMILSIGDAHPGLAESLEMAVKNRELGIHQS